MEDFLTKLPKAELHVHLEGTLEPELMFRLAQRNGVLLPWQSAEEVREAYHFNNLQEFLDIYYAGASVLVQEEDFYELTLAYLHHAVEQGIVHVEMFFDPQTHTHRGISMETVMKGILRATQEAEKNLGISTYLIMCFLRHLSEADGFAMLTEAEPWLKHLRGVGLDSTEKGNPPAKFQRLFEHALSLGLLTVAHAGEEGPSANIRDAIELLKISRIDHGNSITDDENLMKTVALSGMALTMCPQSNLKLQVVKNPTEHPLRYLLEQGLCVTINSDDPAYFGADLLVNYRQMQQALNLNSVAIIRLMQNSIRGSFLPEDRKKYFMDILTDAVS